MTTTWTDRDEVRFEQKVLRTDGCWHWIGCLWEAGYGQFYLAKRMQRAHRAAYEHLVGEIPSGLTLDHLCRNTGCVNPAHLEPVKRKENILRGFGITAMRARQTHCIRGHELSGDNLITIKRGRQCRACNRLRHRKAWKDGTP